MPHEASIARSTTTRTHAQPVDSPAPLPAAYRVPWRIDRSRDPWFTLVNESDETLRAVHLILSGDGRLMWNPLLRVPPGGEVRFVLQADDPARDCVACVRWFRANGDEFLWRIAF